MRRPRLAVVGSIALLVSLSPMGSAVTLAADPTVTVQAGDTLTSIARRTGISIAQLVGANGISDPDRIYIGQELRLPARATRASQPPSAPATRPAPAAPATSQVVHVVQPGESIWSIAVHYGSSVAAIASANGIADPSFIVSGQRLTVPGAKPTPDPVAPAAPVTKPAPAGLAAAWAERDAIRRLITAEATARGVPVAFALAVAWQESGWQPGVVSWAGAIGVMQLLPSTAEWVSDAFLDSAAVNLYDARSNIRVGVTLLDYYLDRYGRRDLALAAYFQGMTAVDRHGIYPVSRPYIASILALERLLGG